ncbi:MAG: acyl carrier protein [Myxococcota bacterium]
MSTTNERVRRDDLITRFRLMASEIAEEDLSHLTEDARISELGMDSLSMLELVGTLEREYHIRIAEEELADISTVRQLLELVEHRISSVQA